MGGNLIKCEKCGNGFLRKHKAMKTCPECLKRERASAKYFSGGGHMKICPNCGKEFKTLAANHKYCCGGCAYEVQKSRQKAAYIKTKNKKAPPLKKVVKCKHCKEYFERNTNSQLFCSFDCRTAWNYEKKNGIKIEPKVIKCKHCRKEFMQKHFNHKYCTDDCKIADYKERKVRKEAYKARKAFQEKADHREALQEYLNKAPSDTERLLNMAFSPDTSSKKTTKKLPITEVQKVFNEYIRLRDRDNVCWCCGGKDSNMQAGHVESVGAHPEKRFNELNVFLECSRCNTVKKNHKNSNWRLNRLRAEVVETRDNSSFKTDAERREIVKHYRRLINEMKNNI